MYTTEKNSLRQGRSGPRGSADSRTREFGRECRREKEREKKLLAYFIVKAATSRHRRRRRPPLLCLQRSWHFPRCSPRLLGTQGRGSSRSLVPSGPVGQPGPYQGTRTQFLSLSLSSSLSLPRSLILSFLLRLPLPLIYSCVCMTRRGAGVRERG